MPSVSMPSQRLFLLHVLFVAVHRSIAGDAKSPAECREDVQKDIFGEDNELSMLQRHAHQGLVKNYSSGGEDEPPVHVLHEEPLCRRLTNKGAYHTIVVEVGVPPQKFNLVADTGANSLILPDCSCMKSGSCSGINKCFETDHSESFHFKMMESDAQSDSSKGTPESAMLYFGSGPINCTLASDEVRLGDAAGTMPDIFLMQDRNELKVTSSFEGLLGLGQPRDPDADVADTMKKDLFMKVAGVKRYSICFNADTNGIFRMHVPTLPKPMSSIGDLHWAFDFQGISVGNNTKADDVLFCHPSTKEEGWNSACNAVPDSGTTMMLGPREHIIKMFEQVCNEWPRCKKYVKEYQLEDKAQGFQRLVAECKDWMDEEDGVDEIPPIKLHLAGGDGKQQVFDLSPWSWVVKTSYPIYVFIQEKLFGKGSVNMTSSHDDMSKDYCSTMFSAHDADTDLNGPQWLFGSPLFFEKVVHFDIGSDPPLMSITNSECAACQDQSSFQDQLPIHHELRSESYPVDSVDGETWVDGLSPNPNVSPSLLSESESTPVNTKPVSRSQRQLRHLKDFPRMPHWDFTQPL